MTKILSFAGQGSQYYQMGREHYANSETFRFWLQKSDALVKQRFGFSLLEKIYDPQKTSQDLMSEIQISHPALFVVQYAMAQVILEAESTDFSLIGFSLGEMVAMAVAEIWSFEEALAHVLDQVDWLLSEGPKGHLIAVFASKEHIDEALFPYQKNYAYAIHSCQNLYSLAMPFTAVGAIENTLKSKNIPFQRLPINHPFHSSWLGQMEPFFQKKAATLQFKEAKKRFGSCTKHTYMKTVDAEHLWHIVGTPLLLETALGALVQQEDILYDCSPTSTLKALLRTYHGFKSPLVQQAKSFMSPWSVKKLHG